MAEVGYMLNREGGPRAEASFLQSMAAGDFTLVDLTRKDLGRMSELVLKYGDLPLGTTDASVIALAERLGVAEVATRRASCGCPAQGRRSRHERTVRPESDVEVCIQGCRQSRQQRHRWSGTTGFKARELRLRHASPLGQFTLRQAKPGTPVVDHLAKKKGGTRLLVRRRMLVSASSLPPHVPCAHHVPNPQFHFRSYNSVAGAWFSCPAAHACCAATARSTSARSTCRVFLKTVSSTALAPGASQ